MALSISGAMTANFLFLGVILYRKLDGFSLSYLTTGLGKVSGAAVLMGLYLYWFGSITFDWMQRGFFNELAGLFISILTGAAVYGVALYLLKLKELNVLVNKVLGKS
jgi:putative peptidoglycan lipid II flippase